ncbi:MAG: N-acetylglucosamine kinase [Bacteroidetes bacterium]|nr:N-acetylglucosamine kinase [Bacteroidota bacterium]
MILVCDSGSTKADWKLAHQGVEIAAFSTIGLNPFFQSSESVGEVMLAVDVVAKHKEQVHSVKFYGAGCSHESRNAIIVCGLKKVFAKAEITVGHDLLAAAYATCNDEPGIACILGTGSNSCFFDGTRVVELNHGLGYILGDEGSGSYYGKKLLAYYFYNVMPEDLRLEFYKKFNVTKEAVLETVYFQPNVNVYLASFSKFLSEHSSHPWIINLVSKTMGEFMDVNVCNIPDYKKYPVHFIGSIAFHFAGILKLESEIRHIKVGQIISKPIQNLLEYFLKKEKIRQ